MLRNKNMPSSRSETRRSGIARNAKRVGTALLAAVVIVPGAETIRETGFYELKDKPALKDKVNGVKDHQRNLQGIVKDAQWSPLGVAETAPYSKSRVIKLRGLLKRVGNLEKAVPPLVTHEEFKGGGSITASHFSSEGSREATVRALEDTMEATRDIKTNGAGLDAISDIYETKLAEERGKIAQTEERAIAEGLTAVQTKAADIVDGKPILQASGYMLDLDRNVGLAPGGGATADYPKGDHSVLAVPDEVLPTNTEQAIHQLTGSPNPDELQIKLPK